MDSSLQSQIAAYQTRLDELIRRGRGVCEALAPEPSNPSAIAAARAWQEACGSTINQLSGGSKAHWLARAFSDAFLLRAESGQAATESSPVEIAERLLGVLEQARGSLSNIDEGSFSSQPPPSRQFDFVHDSKLRPVVEQAYADGRHAQEQGKYDLALLTYCGILEAIVTDALQHRRWGEVKPEDLPAGKIADWSFDTRLAMAERAGLIQGGCSRLPRVARAYREVTNGNGDDLAATNISQEDARRTGQVLHVVMRDLNPGR